MISGDMKQADSDKDIRPFWGTIKKKDLKVSLQVFDDDNDEILFYMWGKLSADFKKISGEYGNEPNEAEDVFKITLDEKNYKPAQEETKEEVPQTKISPEDFLPKIQNKRGTPEGLQHLIDSPDHNLHENVSWKDEQMIQEQEGEKVKAARETVQAIIDQG